MFSPLSTPVEKEKKDSKRRLVLICERQCSGSITSKVTIRCKQSDERQPGRSEHELQTGGEGVLSISTVVRELEVSPTD